MIRRILIQLQRVPESATANSRIAHPDRNFTTMKLISRWVRLDKILSPPTFAHIVSVTYFSRILVLRVTGIEQNRILFVSKTREIVEC
jgi:hypothetical protein